VYDKHSSKVPLLCAFLKRGVSGEPAAADDFHWKRAKRLYR
jgi:hypothetical protein